MKAYESMTKTELIAEITKMKNAGHGRKSQVLQLLKDGFDTIESIAEEIDITRKNVSSTLSALRKQGHCIINIRVKGQSVLQMLSAEQQAEMFGTAEETPSDIITDEEVANTSYVDED